PPLRRENAVSRSCRSCSVSDLLWFLAAALRDGTTANLDAIPRPPFQVQMLPDLPDWSPATTCHRGWVSSARKKRRAASRDFSTAFLDSTHSKPKTRPADYPLPSCNPP